MRALRDAGKEGVLKLYQDLARKAEGDTALWSAKAFSLRLATVAVILRF